MAERNDNTMSTSMTWGLFIFVGVYALVSLESVPGWGMLNLGLPTWLWVVVMTATGALSGALMLEKYRLLGAVGGLLAGLGAMLFVIQMLTKTSQVRSSMLIMSGMIGALPGIGIAALGSWILNRRAAASESQEESGGN